MTSKADVVKALKGYPRLKHVKTDVLKKAVDKLIADVCSNLFHVKTKKEKVPLPSYIYRVDEYGDRDEEIIEFYYEGGHYDYWYDDLVIENGQKYFHIETSTYLCPLCGDEIVMKFISSKIIKGGYTTRYYKGVSDQAMCHKCSRKIDKEQK